MPALKADRPTLVVGGSALLVALLVLYLVAYFWLMRQDYAEEIANIEPRTARLLGIQERRDQLDMASSDIADVLLDLAYPAGRDSATAAAAMQQDVRELMTGAGLSISGSQILSARKVDGFERLSLDISVEGNVDAIDEALADMRDMRPLVFVESMTAKPARDRRRRRSEAAVIVDGDPRMLNVRFRLLSLRLTK